TRPESTMTETRTPPPTPEQTEPLHPPTDPLARAQWLGYLKVNRLSDPLVNAYLAWCHAHNKAAVVLYPEPRCRRVRASSRRTISTSIPAPALLPITYQLPSWCYTLSDDATERIRQLTQQSLALSTAQPIVTPAGGEITGLAADRAEELAFRIADVAHDA